MIKAHATSHGAYAAVLTPQEQSVLESYLSIDAQANTLIRQFHWDGSFYFNRFSDQRIESEVEAPITDHGPATTSIA